MIGIFVFCGRRLWNEYTKVMENYVKFRTYFRITNKWLALKEQKESLEKYFVKNKFKTVAIYGMGALGKHLVEELKMSVINNSIEVLMDKDELPEVDVVVVMPVLEFDTIKTELCSKVKSPFVSLEEIINEIA